ncbi:ankyrin repeat domain-containing protein [Streptomyces sp. NPDC059567]|uniref:ankyrin repeat domain-containing protein n=1 Tax=Streptomyces sp. NPDC059567 TaxID=3346867 RepID=UPI0036A8CB7D
MGQAGDDERLVAAVRAGDAEEVERLLGAGADPDTVAEDGLPVLCLAVAAYDAGVAEVLVEGRADPDRVLPDGTTPLSRAVEGGSPAVFDAVLERDPGTRLPKAQQERLLGIARSWYETGAEAELRRRTGASGPAQTVRIRDGESGTVDQVSLGGLTVRAGHGAILTSLERYFGVLTPAEVLMERALADPDPEHADRSAVLHPLGLRLDRESWSAVLSARHPSERDRRLFALQVLRYADVLGLLGERRFDRKEPAALLASWTADESDPKVLWEILDAYIGLGHPEEEAIGLRLAGHADPYIRASVHLTLGGDEGAPLGAEARRTLFALTRDPHPTVRASTSQTLSHWQQLLTEAGEPAEAAEFAEALLALARDPDPGVRGGTAATFATGPDRSPAVADMLWRLLDEDEQLVRLEAAYGLALRDDPRTEDAYERVGRLPWEAHWLAEDHRLLALDAYRSRHRDGSADAEP